MLHRIPRMPSKSGATDNSPKSVDWWTRVQLKFKMRRTTHEHKDLDDQNPGDAGGQGGAGGGGRGAGAVGVGAEGADGFEREVSDGQQVRVREARKEMREGICFYCKRRHIAASFEDEVGPEVMNFIDHDANDCERSFIRHVVERAGVCPVYAAESVFREKMPNDKEFLIGALAVHGISVLRGF